MMSADFRWLSLTSFSFLIRPAKAKTQQSEEAKKKRSDQAIEYILLLYSSTTIRSIARSTQNLLLY